MLMSKDSLLGDLQVEDQLLMSNMERCKWRLPIYLWMRFCQKVLAMLHPKKDIVLVLLLRIARMATASDVQTPFGKGDSSWETAVVHEPHEGLDLI